MKLGGAYKHQSSRRTGSSHPQSRHRYQPGYSSCDEPGCSAAVRARRERQQRRECEKRQPIRAAAASYTALLSQAIFDRGARRAVTTSNLSKYSHKSQATGWVACVLTAAPVGHQRPQAAAHTTDKTAAHPPRAAPCESSRRREPGYIAFTSPALTASAGPVQRAARCGCEKASANGGARSV